MSEKEIVKLPEKLETERKTFVSHGGGSIGYCRKLVGAPDGNGKYPVVLLLHGAGERGDDNGKQLVHGAADILAFAEKEMKGLLFLAPQCPCGRMWIEAPWNLPEHRMTPEPTRELALALEMLDSEIAESNGDPDRIYITGLSMGSFGAWDAISRKPEFFAGAMCVCGGGDIRQAEKLVGLPILAFHGECDTVVMPSRSHDMFNAVAAAGGRKIEYTEFNGVGHNAWVSAYATHENLRKLFSCTRNNAR